MHRNIIGRYLWLFLNSILHPVHIQRSMMCIKNQLVQTRLKLHIMWINPECFLGITEFGNVNICLKCTLYYAIILWANIDNYAYKLSSTMCLNGYRQIYKLYETTVCIAYADNWSIYSPQAFSFLKFYHPHKYFLLSLGFSFLPFSNAPMGVLELVKRRACLFKKRWVAYLQTGVLKKYFLKGKV